MTAQKHEEPLTFRQIVTAAAMLGFTASVVSTACDYFIHKNTLYESARYGISMGVGIINYLTTGAFLAVGESI